MPKNAYCGTFEGCKPESMYINVDDNDFVYIYYITIKRTPPRTDPRAVLKYININCIITSCRGYNRQFVG